MSGAKIENPFKPPEPETADYLVHSKGDELPAQKEGPVYELDPPVGGFEYRDTDYESIDPDNAVLSQLQRSAEARHNPGMVGLEWVEADGMRYRVSSHEKLTRTRTELRKSRMPRIAKNSVLGPEIEFKEIPEEVEEQVDYRTVDVINPDGEIVDILTFTGTRREWIPRTAYGPIGAHTTFYGRPIKPNRYEDVDVFEEHFFIDPWVPSKFSDYHPRRSRDIVGFRWTERPPEPEIKRVGRVDAPHIGTREPRRPELMSPEEKTQRLFEALANQQAELGLDDWRGLTWNSPFTKRVLEKDESGNEHWITQNYGRMQIIRDEIVMKKHGLSGEKYVERMFEVRTTSQDGAPSHRHMYTLSELWDLFSRKETADRKLERSRRSAQADPEKDASKIPPRVSLNLHWETGQPLGHADEESTRGEDPYLTFEDAIALLVGKDLEASGQNELGRLMLQSRISKIKGAKALDSMERHQKHEAERMESIQLYAKELLKTFEEVGSDHVYAIVEGMRSAYSGLDIDLHRLGIKTSHGNPPEPIDDGEILLNLMQRRIKGGPEAQKLFSESPDERRRRFALEAEADLGWRFVSNALKVQEQQVPDNGPGSKDGKKTIFVRSGNQDVLGRIRHLLFYRRIDEVLEAEKESMEKSKLGPEDFLAIGRMLRLSFGRI